MPNCNCNQRERLPMARACEPNPNLLGLPLGMAYVPWQCFDTVYEVDKALEIGTIFPELNKPFLGKRRMKR